MSSLPNPAPGLHLILLQSDLHWEDPEANFAKFRSQCEGIKASDLVVLPEMFSSGFTMQPGRLPADIGQKSLEFLQEMARLHKAGFCGSTAWKIGAEGFVNRMLFVDENGKLLGHYDKRHRFAMAGEDQSYLPGSPNPVILNFKGWRILLQVCYDLRFPVFSRNLGPTYDLAIYVANWPQARHLHWTTLLQARAIENQAFVVGVNRTGEDGNGLQYQGDTCAFDALGKAVLPARQNQGSYAIELLMEELRSTRDKLPFLRDADPYTLHT